MEQIVLEGQEGKRTVILYLFLTLAFIGLLLGTGVYFLGKPPFFGNWMAFVPMCVSLAVWLGLRLIWGLSKQFTDLISQISESATGETTVFFVMFAIGMSVWVVSAILKNEETTLLAERLTLIAGGLLAGASVGRNREKNRQKTQRSETKNV